MKQMFSFILAATLILTAFQNVATLVVFSINHDYIVSTYCISANAPENMCGGSCYITAELAKSSPQGNQRLANVVGLDNLNHHKPDVIVFLNNSIIDIVENNPYTNIFYKNTDHHSLVDHPPQVV